MTLLRFPASACTDTGLLVVLLFSIFSRSVQTAGLEPVPLWVDGLNHFTKLSLLARDQTLPLHINYPYGYHLLSYFLHLISSLDLPAAAFHTGFWLSALAPLAAYPLARRLLPQRGLAILSIILYGFLAPFPAYLATWSRFPFLLGLVLLPLALASALDWLETQRQPLPQEFLKTLPPALLTAALALSHYGTLVHFVAFLLAALIIHNHWKQGQPSVSMILLRLAGLASPAIAILAIKILSLVQQGLWKTVLAANQSADQAIDLRYSLNLTTQAGGWLLWILAAAGLLAALAWKPHRKTAAIAVTGLMILYLLDVLQLKLLGTAVSSLMNFLLALSLPLSWLAASAIDSAAHNLQSFIPEGKIRLWLPASALLVFLLIGFASISGIINPVTILLTSQDQQAMTWIRQQTATESVFLIDSFQWGQSLSPANGGGWIPALTGRAAIHPYNAQQQADLQTFLAERQVSYVYAARGMPLPDIPLFTNAQIVFQNDQVTIYAFP
jgi:hypothetical protein